MKTFQVTDKFKMYCENEMERYRCESFREKEPETLAWIEDFEDGKVFFDIGANVGIYSLYAASLFPNMQIYAFEPMPNNFIRLLQNVELNGFDNVYCFNAAFGKEDEVQDLFIPNSEVGQSGAQTGEPIGEDKKDFKPEKVIKVMTHTIDTFICGSDIPTYIKIDVDGKEDCILKGMEDVWYEGEFVSMLIECNKESITKEHLMDNFIDSKFFTLDDKYNNRLNHSRQRRGANPENVVISAIDYIKWHRVG